MRVKTTVDMTNYREVLSRAATVNPEAIIKALRKSDAPLYEAAPAESTVKTTGRHGSRDWQRRFI